MKKDFQKRKLQLDRKKIQVLNNWVRVVAGEDPTFRCPPTLLCTGVLDCTRTTVPVGCNTNTVPGPSAKCTIASDCC
jgi:hypothetical protein